MMGTGGSSTSAEETIDEQRLSTFVDAVIGVSFYTFNFIG
jgi:hypothetical protein